jgi:hypothetical protein
MSLIDLHNNAVKSANPTRGDQWDGIPEQHPMQWELMRTYAYHINGQGGCQSSLHSRSLPKGVTLLVTCLSLI